MTPTELLHDWHETFGPETKWPNAVVVDQETYAQMCQLVFNQSNILTINNVRTVTLSVGPHRGLMFKNVELLLLRP